MPQISICFNIIDLFSPTTKLLSKGIIYTVYMYYSFAQHYYISMIYIYNILAVYKMQFVIVCSCSV